MANGVTNKDLYDGINDFRKEVRETYVTKDDFQPVKRAVYGTVAILGAAFLTLLIAIVIPSSRKVLVPSATTSNTPVATTANSTPPTASASATSHSDSATPSDSQTSSSPTGSGGGLLNDTLKQTGL